MRISEQWLREFVNPDVTTETLAEQFNQLGLEVDSLETAAPDFSGIVVARITHIEPHPDAEKLRVCAVDAGDGESIQIVCGAKNAEENGVYPLAKVGAVLPGDFKIKKAKLRGVESFGMLCSAKEIGLAESADGLLPLPVDAPVGQDLREYLGLDDQVIEVDLTPNRGDCLSMIGVSRELATLNECELQQNAVESVPAQTDTEFKVEIKAPEACPRYAGRVIQNINPKASCPIWLIERLRKAGIRSISPVVDVTNYVMLECGQPMHAFDLDKLSEGIVVRLAQNGEKLLLLDGNEVELNSETLVISDHQQPCAIAGVMGGELSAVSEETQHIFLESAFFAVQSIMGRARSYGLHTDSSHRFERGVDPQLQQQAIERATALLLEIVGGQPGPVIDISDTKAIPTKPTIMLRAQRIQRLLGIEFPTADVERILVALGMQVESNNDGWSVTPPTYRFDINIEADIIEELARIYGYERIPRTLHKFAPSIKALPESEVLLDTIKETLHGRNLQEVITYSFVSPELQSILSPNEEALSLANPISSEMSQMRVSLMPGLIETLRHNVNRQQKGVNIYEVGLRFISQDIDIKQERVISGLRFGDQSPAYWQGDAGQVDFFDIKGDVEALLALGGVGLERCRFETLESPLLHPGQAATVYIDEQQIGFVGALHPGIEQKLGLDSRVYLFELELEHLTKGIIPKFKELSKFPRIRRDIAIVVDETVSWTEVEACIRKRAPKFLVDIQLFDIYTGKSIKSNRKSFAMGLILQEISRNLKDEDVDVVIDQILADLQENLGATLRE